MDHFNVTVAQNGSLISTRRGLQVSKQKFNGTSFVNLYPQTNVPNAVTDLDLSQPQQRNFKFVTKQKEPMTLSVRSKAKDKGKEPQANDTTTSQAKIPVSRRQARRSVSSISSAAASTSQGSSTQPSFAVSVQDFYGIARLGKPTPALPTWTTHDLPSCLTEENRKLFHSYFSLVPRKMYPFEDVLEYNPSRSYEFYYLVINDLAALHCVLMCGSMFESIAKGDMSSKDLAYHISKVCSIINRQLDNKSGKVGSITLECITTLALMGNYIGRYDDWHTHMRGLQKIIEFNGGLEGVRPALLSKIRKTDIKGAVSLASSPYLPFRRMYKNASDTLPIQQRQRIVADVSSILSSCRLSSLVTTTVSDLAKLVSAYAYARSSRLVTFDPNAFTEEYQAVQYTLVCEPGPLRSGTRPGTPLAETDPINLSWLRTEDFIKNHHAAIGPIVPAECNNTLEPLLRISCLLYLKELLPDFPRNLGGYGILLTLLTHHLRLVIDEYRTKTTKRGMSPQGDELLDPHLLKSLSKDSDVAREEQVRKMEPVLIWVCLIGNLVSLVADKNEWRLGTERYDRSAYRECLSEVVGITIDTVGKLSGSDLGLCRVLDIRWIQDEKWDDRSALRRILAEKS